MNNRPTFTFKNPKVQERAKEIHDANFIVSKRSIDLFKQGEGGLSSQVDKDKPKATLVGAQSYIGLVNLDTLEIELIPAEKSFIFAGKTYGVISAKAGFVAQLLGFMHNEALAQTNLQNLGNNAGRILGFGLVKGNGIEGKPEPFILNFLNRSASQNGGSITYKNDFQFYNYHLGEKHLKLIQRSIPKVLSNKIMTALCDQLPCSSTQQPNVFTTRNDNFAFEDEFQSLSDEKIGKRLHENMLLAFNNEDCLSLEAICSLRNFYPQIDVNMQDANGNTLLLLAAEKNLSDLINLLVNADVDVNKINSKGKSAAMHAIEHRNEKMALLCINKMNSVTLDQLDNEGNCALSIAIEKHQTKTANILLPMGANPNQALYSILHTSNENDSNAEDKIQLLVRAGADFNEAINIAQRLGDLKSEEKLKDKINKTSIYKQQIEHYLNEQLKRLPSGEKRIKLEGINKNLNECKCIKDAKDIAKEIKEITFQHQATGMAGFFKLNWIKAPESYRKAVNDLNFDDNNSSWNLRNS